MANTCPWCVKAKDFLKENNVEFEEINVGEDQAAAQEMIEKTGQMGVPVIEVDDKIIVGFNEEKLKELKGCEVHMTHMPTPGDEAGLRRLGVNLTSEPKYSTKGFIEVKG